MFIDEALDLIDLADTLVGIDDSKKEDIQDVLKQVSLTIELGSAIYFAYEKTREALKSNDLSPAELSKVISDSRKRIEALKV